ncbi:MAG: amidohydrolase [Oscillospiraceae bacterium]|nr:amidohydrolase [Oscillospiraceae bacterium]
MYIDFHTHAFADKIAERAIAALTENATDCGYKPLTNGTVADLKRILTEQGIDKAVILPIATKPTQQTIINNWAREIKDDFFCPFGSIHPMAEDWSDELERIKSLGLYGVKFHPDYQNFFVNDEFMYPIYRKCAELGLPVVFHAGYDPISPDVTHCTPEAAAEVFDKVPELTMILAHGGGMRRWDDVEKYLAGKPGKLYFDVSVIAKEISGEQLYRIIKAHGADRILFGSDCPWDTPQNEIKMINDLPLSDEEKELIFHKNAVELLRLSI